MSEYEYRLFVKKRDKGVYPRKELLVYINGKEDLHIVELQIRMVDPVFGYTAWETIPIEFEE